MSNDRDVATVDQTGLVTAVGAGNCRITAYDSNDGYLQANIDIAVNVDSGEVNTIPVESISITPMTGGNIVDIGAGLKVQATITPDNATNKALTWTSSSDEVATVIPDVTNDYTIVKGVSAGTATIYATATDGSGIQAQFEVTVDGNSELQANLDLLLKYNNNTEATVLNNDKVNAFVHVNEDWYFAKEPTTCVIRQYNESEEQIAHLQSSNHTSNGYGYAVFTFEGNFKLDAQLRSVRVEIYDVDSNTLATDTLAIDTFTVEELGLSAKSAVEITGLEIIEQVDYDLTLSVGDTNETKVSVLPQGAEPGVDYKAITVESSNSDVMSVALDLENFNYAGMTYINKYILTALATGNTTITYKAIGLNDEVLATLTTDYVVE